MTAQPSQKNRTSRAHAKLVRCPECGAGVSEDCFAWQRSGVPRARKSMHEARHVAAVAAGAPIFDPFRSSK